MITLENVIFYGLAAIATALALYVVTARNMFRAALALSGVLSVVGALYAFLGADFLAASQILVYVGGVMVLVLFIVMFVQAPDAAQQRQTSGRWMWGFGISLVLAALFIEAFHQSVPEIPAPVALTPTSAAIGRLLLSDLLIPFEVVSMILLAALVGAVVFAGERDA